MPKTDFLQIRFTPADLTRLAAVAAREHLELSTWARRELLMALERYEIEPAPRLRVAESSPERVITETLKRPPVRKRPKP